MLSSSRLAFVGLALALSLAGCASGTRLVLKDDGGVLVEGISRGSPMHRAMLEVYEACGGAADGKITEINWRSGDSPLPVWTEERGWHFKDFECLPSDEAAAEKLGPQESGAVTHLELSGG